MSFSMPGSKPALVSTWRLLHEALFFPLDAQTRWSQLNHNESIAISGLSALQLMFMTAITHGQDNLGLAYWLS